MEDSQYSQHMMQEANASHSKPHKKVCQHLFDTMTLTLQAIKYLNLSTLSILRFAIRLTHFAVLSGHSMPTQSSRNPVLHTINVNSTDNLLFHFVISIWMSKYFKLLNPFRVLVRQFRITFTWLSYNLLNSLCIRISKSEKFSIKMLEGLDLGPNQCYYCCLTCDSFNYSMNFVL